MIGIQLDGDNEFLETSADTSIEITLKNPLLGDAEVLSPGSFSLPFPLPCGKDSPVNEEKLQHPAVIENNAAFEIRKASLFFDGVPFKKGNLKVSSSEGDNKLESNFSFGLNSLNPNLKTARLRDVLNEEVVIDSAALTKKIYLKIVSVDPDVDHSSQIIIINGKEYPYVDADVLAMAVNTDGLNSGVYGPYVNARSVVATPGGMAPPYLEIFSAKLTGTIDDFAMTGLIVDPNPDPLAEINIKGFTTFPDRVWQVEITDLSSYWDAFSTFMADYLAGAFPSDKYRFPVYFNANLYDGDNASIKESEIINGCNADGLIFNQIVCKASSDEPVKYRNKNSLQPFLFRKYVLDKIATAFGFEWDGDFYELAAVANMLEDNSTTLDQVMELVGEKKIAFWRRSFNLNELVPDISVIEYLKAIASRYNLGAYPNEETQKVRLKFREAIAKSNAFDDITPLSSPKKGGEDIRVTGYNLICKKEESDKLSVSDEQVIVGIAQEQIEITCGRLVQTKGQNTTGYVYGPRVSRRNNEQKIGVRVFHFRGMRDNGIFSYQFADIHGADFSELLNGEDGIYNRYFKYWLAFKKNWRKVVIDVRWPLRTLLKFDFEKKRRFDRSNFLVSSIKIKMTNQRLFDSEVELYTMKN